MSEKIAILADSGSDLPSNLVAQDNVAIVSMQIHWHGEVLRDRVDISPNEFYRALKTSKELPKTSSPQMSDIISQVTRLREKGYTHLLVIGVSSKLSVTFNQMYLQAKSTPDTGSGRHLKLNSPLVINPDYSPLPQLIHYIA